MTNTHVAAVETPFGPADFAAATGVSRETLARLVTYARLLIDWQDRLNLVGRSTLPDLWRRHMLDSAQLLEHVDGWADAAPPLTWVDLGTGAGFPGMVLALMGAGSVHLVEKSPRKCQFLRAVAAETGAPVTIHEGRAEDLALPSAAIITSRALAPLRRLLAMAYPFFGPGSEALFHKGQDVDNELTEATKYWKMDVTSYPSITDPRGRIIRVKELARV